MSHLPRDGVRRNHLVKDRLLHVVCTASWCPILRRICVAVSVSNSPSPCDSDPITATPGQDGNPVSIMIHLDAESNVIERSDVPRADSISYQTSGWPSMPSSRRKKGHAMRCCESRELASFFAQLRAAIGISLDRPAFCVFRVWLRFLLFLFRVRVSVPVSRAACRVRPTFPPSSSAPSLHPNISINPFHSPRRRNRTQRV